jgi:hypothetical protein
MISAVIRREREHCCDDLVLAHTREPLYYATALAALASTPGDVSAFTVAASGQSHYLFNRIKRIMEMKKNPFSYSRMVAAILIVATITASVVWLTPSFADSRKGSSVVAVTKASEPAKPATKEATPATRAETVANEQEGKLLIQRLTEDQLVDPNIGFTVMKSEGKLIINRVVQPAELAAKYLPIISQESMIIEVYPVKEWLSRHPWGLKPPFIYQSMIWKFSTKLGC